MNKLLREIEEILNEDLELLKNKREYESPSFALFMIEEKNVFLEVSAGDGNIWDPDDESGGFEDGGDW